MWNKKRFARQEETDFGDDGAKRFLASSFFTALLVPFVTQKIKKNGSQIALVLRCFEHLKQTSGSEYVVAVKGFYFETILIFNLKMLNSV